MTDQKIHDSLIEDSEEFRKLNDEHVQLKDKLRTFKERVHLSPEEEIEKKNIQKLKLKKKDRMAELLEEYKKNLSVN